MENIFSTCDKCGNNIQYSEPHVSINKYVEYAEYVSARNRIESTPIDSLQLLTLCNSCGKSFDNILSKTINEFSENKK